MKRSHFGLLAAAMVAGLGHESPSAPFPEIPTVGYPRVRGSRHGNTKHHQGTAQDFKRREAQRRKATASLRAPGKPATLEHGK